MAEDHSAGAARYGPYSRTIEEIRAAQGRIRAASARQRRLAASMRAEALELNEQHRRVASKQAKGKHRLPRDDRHAKR